MLHFSQEETYQYVYKTLQPHALWRHRRLLLVAGRLNTGLGLLYRSSQYNSRRYQQGREFENSNFSVCDRRYLSFGVNVPSKHCEISR